MRKWIRWPGLAAFIIIFVFMALIWLVVVDWIAEKTIETAGTRAVGARVDVARADVTLFPAGVDVTGLEVTDPDNPMRNAVAVKRLHAAIQLAPLLRRKMIVDDLRVEGLRFNTARSASGALPAKQVAADTQSDPPIPPWLANICGAQPGTQLSIPRVEDILSREPLQTLQQAEALRSRIDTARTTWQRRLKELPDQNDLEAYQRRIEKLKAGGGLTALLGSASQVQTLHADMRKDLKQIRDARQKYQSELQALQKQSAALARAPALEAQRLQAQYALAPKGAANISRVLFGPQVCGWWQQADHWYRRIKPYMARKPAKQGEPQTVPPVRGKGVDVRFAERHPLPDFLIRKVHVDAQLETGSFTGQVADITSQPHILGKPLTFKFLGRQLKQLQAVNLNGMLNFVQPDTPRYTIKMLIEQWTLQNLDLSHSNDWPLSIAQALTNLNMKLDLAGPELDANLNAQLHNVRMTLKAPTASELSQALEEAIASVRKFGIAAAVKGADPVYRATLDSDLDQILQKAVGQLVRKAGARLESQLRQAISEKTAGPIGDAQSRLGGLDKLGTEFTRRLNLGDNLIKNLKLPL